MPGSYCHGGHRGGFGYAALVVAPCSADSHSLEGDESSTGDAGPVVNGHLRHDELGACSDIIGGSSGVITMVVSRLDLVNGLSCGSKLCYSLPRRE